MKKHICGYGKRYISHTAIALHRSRAAACCGFTMHRMVNGNPRPLHGDDGKVRGDASHVRWWQGATVWSHGMRRWEPIGAGIDERADGQPMARTKIPSTIDSYVRGMSSHVRWWQGATVESHGMRRWARWARGFSGPMGIIAPTAIFHSQFSIFNSPTCGIMSDMLVAIE